MTMVRELLRGVESLLFPVSCAGCESPLGDTEPPLCERCNSQLPRSRPLGSHRRGRAAFQTISPCHYEGVAKKLVVALKYQGRLSLAPFLGKRMADAVREHLGPHPADGVVPVPLHATRLRERSFNQAQILSLALARQLHLPCWPGLLIREKPTRSQPELNRRQRLLNVKGAFRLQPDPRLIQATVLLVDDVLTTGATANSCVRLLKQGGAAKVIVVTFVHGSCESSGFTC